MYASSIIARTINLSSMRYARHAMGNDIYRQKFGRKNLREASVHWWIMSVYNLSIKGEKDGM
jgi:hypothetical protein